MQDARKAGPLSWIRHLHFGEVEVTAIPDPDNEDALAVLGHERTCVDHAHGDVVAEILGEHAADDLKSPALVMTLEVLDVLQQECLRPLLRDNPGDVEEQGALSLILEPVLPAKGILLRDARDGEGLTREPGDQYVVVGDVAGINLGDVTR